MSEKSNPQVKIGHYIIGETLGTGTFGKVKGGYEYNERMSYGQATCTYCGGLLELMPSIHFAECALCSV